MQTIVPDMPYISLYTGSIMIFRNVWASAVLALLLLVQTTATTWGADDKGQVLIFQTEIGGDLWHSGLHVQAWTIDGKLKMKMFGKPVKAPPGKHTVGVRIAFAIESKNILLAPSKNYADVFEFDVTLMPGRSYTATGKQSGSHIEAWIEERETRQLVSKVLEIDMPECTPFKCPRPAITTRSELY